MRRITSRAAALLCGVLCLCFVLSSCGKTPDTVYYVDESGKTRASMNENMFSYHLSERKTYYLYSIGASSDAASLWSMATDDGRTVGERAMESIVENAKKMVASAYVYDTALATAGSDLSGTDAQLQKQVDDLIASLQSSKGTKSAFASYLAAFGVDEKNLRKYYEMYYKMAAVQAAIEVTEEEKQAYFTENYAVVKHILVNTSFKVKEDGSKVSLSDEEKAQKEKQAAAIEARLSSGESFEDLWEEFKDADAAGAAKYPHGYFVCENSGFTPEFETAALDMRDGEIRTVTSTYGIHIMKKYPTDASLYNAYSDVEADLQNAVSDAKFREMIAPYTAMVRTNDAVLAQYSVTTAPVISG